MAHWLKMTGLVGHGFVVNCKKGFLGTQQVLEHFGVLIDIRKFWMYLSDQRKLREALYRLHKAKTVDSRDNGSICRFSGKEGSQMHQASCVSSKGNSLLGATREVLGANQSSCPFREMVTKVAILMGWGHT